MQLINLNIKTAREKLELLNNLADCSHVAVVTNFTLYTFDYVLLTHAFNMLYSAATTMSILGQSKQLYQCSSLDVI